ncbi:MAG: YcaQ family DNA glycosylase [Burkholderiales bacterium]|nr:YcaQ family DNA glycosylase [Burkholderiales bacterium]
MTRAPGASGAPHPRPVESVLKLSRAQARRLQLLAMGLAAPPKPQPRKADVLATIRRMQVLQIDTIHVVARSPYLVLWSRLGDYRPEWLDALLASGALFEYWAHAACFIPIEHYPYYRRQMLHLEAAGSHRAAARLAAEPVAHLELLEHIRERGAVRAADFEHEDGRTSNGWWDWKPDKLRLETLFTAGELMVARREHFRRVYDLRERVLPARWHDDAAVPSQDTVHETWSLAAVKAMGFATARWIGDYFRHSGRAPSPHPERLAAEGKLVRVAVEGVPQPAYVHPDWVPAARRASRDQLVAAHCTLLSPFDPLVWDRERALALWDFDYRIECYTPEAKRRYGYFTLPILVRDCLVGRVDAKAQRQSGRFEIRHLHLEPAVAGDSALADDIAGAIVRCARWHRTPTITVLRTSPTGFAPALRAAVQRASGNGA